MKKINGDCNYEGAFECTLSAPNGTEWKGEGRMERESIELKSLVGEHKLSGVDFANESVKREWCDSYEDCQTMSFVLDGKVYTAIEDPDDGYRSSMRGLYPSRAKIANRFKPCKVLCRMRENRDDWGGYKDNDVLEMVDVKTGKLVLAVGTRNTDDYYPWFEAVFHPDNMACNIGK